MAGGKETPRQKLINLMYLVLLAMLALQVSSAIIQKFEFMNESLESNIDETNGRNQQLLSGISAAVDKAKNNPEDVAVLKKAEKVRKETQQMLTYLNDLKEKLIKETGGRDENGHLVGAKEEEAVAQMMLGTGGSKSGEGYSLKAQLNDYSSMVNRVLKEINANKSYAALALDGKDDPLFQKDPDQKRKDFAELSFESTPLVAALAVISEKQNRILSMESATLGKLAELVGAKVIPVDRLRPVVKSSSKYVVAGTEYEANMFMAAYNSNYKPNMSFEENTIDVNKEGIGEIKFRASGGNYDATGKVKKIWRGTITYPKSDGTDSTYVIEEEYYVVKPAIQVINDAVQTLYKDCGNKLNITVPALGADYNPQISASGARLIRSNQPGKVTVVPNQPRVNINVKNNGVNIGDLKYRVELVPQPSFEVNVDTKRGASKNELRGLRIDVIPNESFAKSNPDDAKYRIFKIEAILIRNGIPKLGPLTYNPNTSTLRDFAREAEPGDRVYLEVKEVKRKTFDGRTVDVPIRTTSFNIPIR